MILRPLAAVTIIIPAGCAPSYHPDYDSRSNAPSLADRKTEATRDQIQEALANEARLREAFEQIRLGMSEERVLMLMGREPDGVGRGGVDNSAVFWSYSTAPPYRTPKRGWAEFFLVFTDGKVVDKRASSTWRPEERQSSERSPT